MGYLNRKSDKNASSQKHIHRQTHTRTYMSPIAGLCVRARARVCVLMVQVLGLKPRALHRLENFFSTELTTST